ncbi:hypothetical protein I4U23_002497 [Adineta vaga]|nr:hypothetical protein I4U23_002497 [Adineta vaga]
MTNIDSSQDLQLQEGKFCIFNFGKIEQLNGLPSLLDRLKEQCSQIHKDLYNHIIINSLTKQPYETLTSIIPFGCDNKLDPEIYETSQETFRILFFVKIDLTSIKSHPNDPILSLFDCICIKA